jgi:membrane-associated protein
MQHLFDIPHLITTYGYIGIFAIVFFESWVAFFMPGDSLLFTAGILASSGILNVYIVVSLIFIATFTGALLGYYIGGHLERLRRVSFLGRVIREEDLHRTHEFFERHGRFAVILSRFVPVVRTLTPMVAGIAEMNYASFLKSTFAGSLLWSAVVTLSGYFLGQTFPGIKDYITLIVVLIIIISVLPVLFGIIKNKRK